MIIINTIHRDREKKHLWYFPSKGSSHIILWICISYCCCCTSSAGANLASTLVTFAVLTNFDVLYKDYKPLYSYNAVALSALSYYSNKPRMARCRICVGIVMVISKSTRPSCSCYFFFFSQFFISTTSQTASTILWIYVQQVINYSFDGTFVSSNRYNMVDKEYTEEEKLFRENYTQELRKKQQAGRDELEEERKNVKQQAMKTPRRRREQIKHEEVDKEIIRRHRLEQQKADEK